jgi:hypothetical protein
MAITWPRVPLVAVGDAVTSTQAVAVAEAANERQRSGLGNISRRIHRYWIGLLRQIRNPDETGFLWPPEHEAFSVYQPLDPADANFPVTGPGEPEGARLDNPMMAYIFGSDFWDLYSEDVRLTDGTLGGVPLDLGGFPAGTPCQIWELAKLQRGAFDPETGALASPVFSAAQSHYRIQYSPYSLYGNSWGGFMPRPEVIGDCGDGTLEFPPTNDYKLFYTPLREGLTTNDLSPCDGVTAVLSYPGTCPAVVGNVIGVSVTPWAYYVFINSGDPEAPTVDILPTKDWIEGPYCGGNLLTHQPGGQLDRVINRFANEHRGSDAQRTDPNYWLQQAFDTQEFHESQYLLAPSVGQTSGGAIVEIYPRFSLSGGITIAAETPFRTSTGGMEQDCNSLCVISGLLVRCSKLAEQSTLTVYDSTGDLASISIAPDEDGNFERIVILNEQNCLQGFGVRAGDDIIFTEAGGEIVVEFSEILAYKPEYTDRFMAVRVCACTAAGATDGRGIDEENAKTISANYFRYGALLNVHGEVGLDGNFEGRINTNGVYDAARRWSQMVRMITRQNLVGYAVEGGKSKFWFRRYAYGMHVAVPLDLFTGIGPERLKIESGALKWGRNYTVRTAPIWYAGTMHVVGNLFTGMDGVTEYTGAGEVYESDGIYHDAPPQGLSNEWLFELDLRVYHPSESSIWKASAYTDQFWYSNRCHFYSAQVDDDDELRWHYNYGGALTLKPESPDGYNYAKGVNTYPYGTTEEKTIFANSCPIYKPPLEIDSATVTIEDGEEIVCLTLNGRLQNTSLEVGGAPASVARDVTTWADDVHAEATTFGRTDENGVREYLVLQATGENCTKAVIGDAAYVTDVWALTDDPMGACYPFFHLTKLIPKPYVDANDRQDRIDTPFWHDTFSHLELWLRAACEGFVDARTTEAYGCRRTDYFTCDVTDWSLFDYSFENLCFDAFGGRWMPLLNTALRADGPAGFGPSPNVSAWAEVYNCFASALNKLDKVRVPIPLQFEAITAQIQDEFAVGALESSGGPATCTNGVVAAYWEGTVPKAYSVLDAGTWAVATSVITRWSATIASTYCLDDAWPLISFREVTEYRVTTTDPVILASVPIAWRDMVPSGLGCLACITTYTTTGQKTIVDASESVCDGNTSFYPVGDGRYYSFDNPSVVSSYCAVITSGTVEAQELGHSVIGIGRSAGGGVCFGAPENSIQITPWLTESTFLQVPLV